MKPPVAQIPNGANERKKRLAEALRENLHLRKARARGADDANGTSDQKDAVGSNAAGEGKADR